MKIGVRCKILVSFLIVFLTLTGCSGGAESTSVQKNTPKDKKGWGNAPDFTLSKLGGGEFTLSALKGKVIILDFWATRCPPCRREIPDFIHLYKKYKDKGLEIVGVVLDKDKEASVGPFAKKMGINYTTVFGNREVTNKYKGIRYIPTTFIIDRNGNIAKKHVGFVKKEVFEAEIKELLEGNGKSEE